MAFAKKTGPGGKGRGRGAKAAGDKKDGQRRGMFRRRKVCKFCAERIDDINYKDMRMLSGFVPERGKCCRAASKGPARYISATRTWTRQIAPALRDRLGGRP
jgi:small subunit ribosomal protein S18